MQKIKFLLLFVWMLGCTVQADAQLNDILNKVVSVFTGQNKMTEQNLVGTWTFTGSGIELTGGKNILKDLASTAASAAVEKKLDGYLAKAGITKDKFVITFNNDKTVVVTTAKGKTHKGTYTINDGTLVIKTANFGNGMTCQTEIDVQNLKLMVKADKLMTLASTLSNITSSSSLKSINKLLENYSGINVGMKFSRQKAVK